MHGPTLTPHEAVASVARQVRRLQAAGLDREQAIGRAAAEYGIEPEKVRWCAETAPGAPSARPIAGAYGDGQPRRQREHRRHSIHAGQNHTLGTASGSRGRRARARLAVAVATLTMGAVALGSQANA